MERGSQVRLLLGAELQKVKDTVPTLGACSLRLRHGLRETGPHYPLAVTALRLRAAWRRPTPGISVPPLVKRSMSLALSHCIGRGEGRR